MTVKQLTNKRDKTTVYQIGERVDIFTWLAGLRVVALHL